MSKATGELTMKESLSIPLFRLDGLIAWVTFLFITVLVFLGIAQLQPPAVVPASAPPTEFSAARAMPHLTAIAQQPHPMGVPAHAEARDYLVKQLGDLGLRVEIQRTTSLNSRNRAPFMAGTVQNIVGRLDGTANTRAIMLVAHYDSILNGPGASDNGAAVAALVETVRALKAGPPLRNDLIVLFTDGEEAGLLGSKVFIEEHPWAKDVGLVLNLEARGNSGPVMLFETSRQNGRLIREFAQAVPNPFASSLFYDLYQRLPNDTDFTEFRLAGMAGLNFAFIDGYLHYHTATDSVENLDQRSLQHHGTYALALTRHFGGLDLNGLNERDEVYFNLFGSTFVHYSSRWVLPLALLVMVVFIVVVVSGFRRKLLTFSGIVVGFLAFLANLLIVPGAIWLLWTLITTLHPEYVSLPHGEPYNGFVYMIGLVGMAIAITAALYILFRRKISLPNLTVGGLTWWLLFTLLTSLLFPGSSYLFAWPLLFSLIGLGIVFRAEQPKNAFTRRFAVLLLCAVPALMLLPPLIYLAYISLTMRVTAAVAALIVILFGVLIPHLRIMATPNRWLLPAAAALVGVGFLGAGNFTSRYDANHPKPNDIMYALNADTGKAIWASAELVQDSWTGQFFPSGDVREHLGDFFPISARPLRQIAAPALPLDAPGVALIDDTSSGELRTVRMRITAPQETQMALVWVAPNTEVVGSLVDGKRVPNNRPIRAGAPWGMIYWAPPGEGVELTLEVKPGQPLRISVVGRKAGIPEVPGVVVTPRPPNMMPPPSLGTVSQYSDATLVVKSFVFAPAATASSN